MINRDLICEVYKNLVKNMTNLRNAWANYQSEPFMSGKVEASDVMMYEVAKAFKILLEESEND